MTPFIILSIFATSIFILLMAAAAVMVSRSSLFDPFPELRDQEDEDIVFEPLPEVAKKAAKKAVKKTPKKASKKSKRKKK